VASDVSEWVWEINLKAMVGRDVRLETKDGVHREGRISKVNMAPFTLSGETVAIPDSIELNGDSEDLVAFNRLATMDVG